MYCILLANFHWRKQAKPQKLKQFLWTGCLCVTFHFIVGAPHFLILLWVLFFSLQFLHHSQHILLEGLYYFSFIVVATPLCIVIIIGFLLSSRCFVFTFDVHSLIVSIDVRQWGYHNHFIPQRGDQPLDEPSYFQPIGRLVLHYAQ